MTMLGKLAAIGSASIAAASAAWVVTTSSPATENGQASAGSGSPIAAVCAGDDRVLRLAGAGTPCASPVALAPAEADDYPAWEDAGPDDAAQRSDRADDALAALERRVSDLEKEHGALFEVVNTGGQPIFRVTPEAVFVYNGSASAVAAIRAASDGGDFIARSSSGLAAAVGATGQRSGVRISERGVTRAFLGKQAQGNYALTFPSPARGIIAGIGESRAGTGALVIGNAGGTVLASMTGTDGKGAFGVSNQQGAPVVSLSEGATRGGLLSIGDASSEPMVRMGVAQDRYGIVLTGPRAGFPLIPGSGLPGSYIMGCAGQGKDCGPDGMGR